MALAAVLLTGCTFDHPVVFPVRTISEPPEPPDDTDDTDEPEDITDLEEEPSYIVICVRKRTRIRVAYRPCDDAESGYAWYFTPAEARVSATGQKAKGGSFRDPGYEGSRARARGGFGFEVAVPHKDRVEVCVKRSTRIRAADSRCDDFEEGFAWYRVPLDGHVPALGRKAEGGSFYSTGTEELRASEKGGAAAKAVIESDEPNNVTPTKGPLCTWTVNGRCASSTTGCGYGFCRHNGGYPGMVPMRP